MKTRVRKIEKELKLKLIHQRSEFKKGIGKRLLTLADMRHTKYRLELCERLLDMIAIVRQYAQKGHQWFRPSQWRYHGGRRYSRYWKPSGRRQLSHSFISDWRRYGVFLDDDLDKQYPVGVFLNKYVFIYCAKGGYTTQDHYYREISAQYRRWCSFRDCRGRIF